MPFIVTRVPRTRQPQTPVGVDWTNPLTRGLLFLGVPRGSRIADISRYGRGVSSTGAGASFANPDLLFSGSQSSGAVSYGDVDWFAGLPVITVGAVCRVTTPGTYNLVAKWGSASQHEFLLQTTSTGHTLAVLDGSNFGVWTSTHAQPVGVPMALAGAWRGGANAYVACNGSVQSLTDTAPNPSGPINNGTTIFQFGIAEDGSPFNGRLSLVPIWGRALTIVELVSWTNNPWQLFAPEVRRIWMPGAGGGANVSGFTSVLALSQISGSVSAGAVLSGATLPINLSFIAGAVSAAASVPGVTFPLDLSFIPGSVSAGVTVTGTTLVLDVSFLGGGASAGGTIVSGFTSTLNLSFISGTVTAGVTVSGNIHTLTLSFIAGAADGGGGAGGSILTNTIALIQLALMLRRK